MGQGQADESEASNDGGLHGDVDGGGLEVDLSRLQTDEAAALAGAFYRFFPTVLCLSSTSEIFILSTFFSTQSRITGSLSTKLPSCCCCP